MLKATVEYSGGGSYRVEFYRDDDDNSGYGDHPEVAHWYVDSMAAGYAIVATGKYPDGLIWHRVGGWQPDRSPGSAAWCETQGDNY